MKTITIFLLTLLMFSACSVKTRPNQWQYKSVNAYNSYTYNFLSSNDALAQSDLKTAIRHAKTGADLMALSRIYLGVCALKISVGQKQECSEYENIADVLDNKELDAYYSFITSDLKKEQIALLPQKYQNFALHLHTHEYSKANEDILKIESATSQLLAASLIREKVTPDVRDKIIETASFHGYKKAVIFWLYESIKATQDKHKKEILSKKISILESKN